MGLQTLQEMSPWFSYAVGLLVIILTAIAAWYGIALPEPSQIRSVTGKVVGKAAQVSTIAGSAPGSWPQLLSKKKWLQTVGLGSIVGFVTLALVLFTLLGRSQLIHDLANDKQAALAEKDAEH